MVVTQQERSAAQQELLARGFSLAGYARSKGFNVLTFRMWLRSEWGTGGKNGKPRKRASSVSSAFVNALREDGILQ